MTGAGGVPAAGPSTVPERSTPAHRAPPEPGRAAGPTGGPGGPGGPDRLRSATREFEAVLIQEMLKAMRDTVPEGGLLDAGRSEEMFTALLDEHVASVAADRAQGSLAEALYRQFAGRATETPAELSARAAVAAPAGRAEP